MSNAKTVVTFEYTHTGQKDAYGDSFTEGTLTVQMGLGDDLRSVAIGEAQAKRLARGFVFWTEDEADPFAPALVSFDVLGEGQYKVVTRARYND